MHGRLKVRTSEEQKALKRKEQQKKLAAYNNGMAHILATRKKDSYESESLSLCTHLLASNPDIYTLWNYRKEVVLIEIERNRGEIDEEEKLITFLENEISLTEQCLISNPKSYGAWYHRYWVLIQHPKPNWENEFSLCTKYLTMDDRNFHCWDYRRLLVNKIGITLTHELQFSTDRLNINFSNYSSWHYRSILRELDEDSVGFELNLVLSAVFTDPADSSAWFYLRWVLSNPAIKKQSREELLDSFEQLEELEPNCKLFVHGACVVATPFVRSRDGSIGVLKEWKSTLEMIEVEGYPTENHYVVTTDGYILNIHRMPNGKTGKKNNRVAILVHGLFETSSDWILLGAGKSLGYILADEGYDVWLINTRGNVYSRNHTVFNPDIDADFWNFSWHEVGSIDVPTVIDYILEKTAADSVYFVGHSQGTTDLFVMASIKPEYNAKIKASVSLAPIAYMNQTRGLVKIVAAFKEPLAKLLGNFSINEVTSNKSVITTFIRDLCSTNKGALFCELSLFAICGFSPFQANTSLIPLLFNHVPAGVSLKQILHYFQLIQTGSFSQFDFGLEENLKKYGTTTPPDYNLSEITAPVYFFYSANDFMTGVEDVEKLFEGIPGGADKFLMSDKLWNHVDFLYGNGIAELNSKIVDIFNKH